MERRPMREDRALLCHSTLASWNGSGCRIDGVKTPYCDSLCPIRQCAREKQMETCGGCLEMKSCEKVGAIIGNNSDARGRLENNGYV